jgi:hypothetical protein
MREKKGQQGLDSWFDWQHWGRLIGKDGNSDDGWNEATAAAFWQENRAAIMAHLPVWQVENADALFWRPRAFMESLEKEHKRRIRKYETWHSPHTGEGPGRWERTPIYEDDQEFLTRLNLLTPLEKEAAAKKQTAKKRAK